MRIKTVMLFLLFVIVPSVWADGLTFSNVTLLQNGGSTSVDLFPHSGAVMGFTVPGEIDFLVQVNGVSTLPDTLSVTFSGSTWQLTQAVPLSPGTYPPPPYGSILWLFTFSIGTGCCYQPRDVQLHVDLLGSNPDFQNPLTGAMQDSYTYSFRLVEPVPEPATLALFAGGAGLVALRRRFATRRG